MYKRANIRALVKMKGGAAQVALLCGVTSASVSQWSSAKSIPAKHARALAQLWGCNPDILHNPWGWRAPYLSDAELQEALSGEVPLYDIDDPIEYADHDDGDYTGSYDEPAEPVKRKSGWTDDEIIEMFGGASDG